MSKFFHEITIQFHRDLFDEKFLHRNQLSFVRSLLDYSARGVRFTAAAIQATRPRLLIDTTLNISEISFKCGFNNLSYFNRAFKKKYVCTPKEFRENYTETRIFV